MIAERRLSESRWLPHIESRPRPRAVPVRRSRRRLAPFLLVAALVVGALVLGVVSLQVMVAENSFRMNDLSRRGAELRQDQGELRLEIAELSSPRRIEREAKRLGLHLSDDVETLRVPSIIDGQAREPGPGGSISGQALSGGSP